MGESFADFLFGLFVGAIFVGVVIAPAACVDSRRSHVKAAMGCTVVSETEIGLINSDSNVVYWRCKDGKVYVR